MSPENTDIQSLNTDTYKYRSWKQLLELLSLKEIPVTDIVVTKNDKDIITSITGKVRIYEQPAGIDLNLIESGNKKAFTLAVTLQQLPLKNLLYPVGLASVYHQLVKEGLLPGITFERIQIEAKTAENSIGISSIAGTNEWSVPGFDKLKLLQLSLGYYRTYSTTGSGSATFILGGRIKIGEVLAESTAQIFTDRPHYLNVHLKQETSIQKNLDEISSFLIGQPLSSILPSSFDQVPDIFLTDLYGAVDLSKLKIESTGITLSIRDSWPIATGLCSIKESQLTLLLNNTDEGVNSTLSISSTVVLLDNLSTTISIEIEDLTSNWQINLDGNLKLPRLRDINTLLVSIDVNSWGLPASVLDQRLQLDIEELAFQFSPAARTVTGMALQAACSQLWEVLPGLKIGNTSVSVTYDPGQAIEGSLSGEIVLNDEVSIILAGEKTGNAFILEGKFEAVESVTPMLILSRLFPAFEFPAVLPDFGIKAGSVYLDAKTKTLVLKATITYGKNKGEAEISLIEGNTLKITAKNWALKEAVEALLHVEYPQELPNPVMENLEISINKNHEISLHQEITDAQGLTIAGSHLQIASLTFDFKREKKDTGFNKVATLSVQGNVDIEQVIVIEDCRFDFNYTYDAGKQKAAWELKNELKARIFGHTLEVKAAYKDAEGTKNLGFTLLTPLPELAIANIARYKLDEIVFSFKKRTKTEKSGAASLELLLAAKSSFETDLFNFEDLKVSLFTGDKRTGLELTAGSTDIKLLGEGYPWFSLDKPAFKLQYNKEDSTWEFEGETTFTAYDVPLTLSKIFPSSSVKSYFKINKQAAELGIHYDGLFCIPLPPKIDGVDLSGIADIGDFYVGIKDFRIDLKNGGKIEAGISIGLPKNLNKVFSDGKGSQTEVFRVYDPGGDKQLISFSLSFSKNGLSLQLENSPFKDFLSIKKEKGKSVLNLDMGDYGEIDVILPEFWLKADGSLKAAGGFHIKRDLALPLTPLIFFLKQIGLSKTADIIKPKVSLKGIPFTAKEGGHYKFNSGAFIDLFADSKGPAVPQWLKDGFQAIDNIASKLPDSFLEYGNLELPDYLYFNIEYTVTNSVKFQVTVKNPEDKKAEAKPLKFIVPQFPSFMGVKLYSISFGELFSGSLFRLDLDVEIDQFDVPTLLASMLLDGNQPFIKNNLPPLKDLQKKIRLENLVVLIIYQTAIPIPIPLFYDEIGLKSITLEGTELISSFHFPLPEVGLSTAKDFALIISQLVKFFKDGKPLEWEKLKQVKFLEFRVGPNYVRLPKYIAKEKKSLKEHGEGKLIGTSEGFSINPVQLFCAFAEAVQKGSFNQLIQMVELKKRIGTFEMSLFDVLDINCKYAFTTPWEFIDQAYTQLELSADQQQDYLKLLPAPRNLEQQYIDIQPAQSITRETEGLVLFLNGKLNVQDFIKFDTGFGMVAMTDGLGIGAKFEGKIGQLSKTPDSYALELMLRGIIAVKKEGAVRLEGEGSIYLLGHTIVKGKFLFHQNGMELSAQLGEPWMPIYAKGDLTGQFTKDIFLLKGAADLHIFGFSAAGSFCIDVSTENKLFYLTGMAKLGSFGKLQAGISYYESKDKLGLQLYFQGSVNHIFDLDLKGDLYADNRTIKTKGSFLLKLLDGEVMKTEYIYSDNVYRFKGNFELLPHLKKYIDISGEAAGELSATSFSFVSRSRVKIMGYNLMNSLLTVDTEKAILASEFFGLKTILYIQKQPKFLLYGSMQPIRLGAHFSITAADQPSLPGVQYPALLKSYDGPSLCISDQSPYFTMQGKASILGITAQVKQLEVKESGFELQATGNVFDLFRAELNVSWNSLYGSANIRVSGSIHIEDIVEEINRSIHEAANRIRESLDKARKDLERAQEDFNNAAKAVASNIKEKIEAFDKQLKEQLVYLEAREKEVAGLNDRISDHHARINNLKNEIESKKAWYNNSAWYEQAYRWIELAAFVGAKGLEIGALYTAIGVLEGLKYTAIGLLEAAKELIRGIRSLKETAESAVDGGLLALKQATKIAFDQANDALIIIRNTVGVFEDWSTKILAAAGSVLTIHSATFQASLNAAEGGLITTDVDITFLGERRQITTGFSFTSKAYVIDTILHTLKTAKKQPDEISIEAKKAGKPALETARDLLIQYPMLNAAQMSVTLLRAGYDKQAEVFGTVLKKIYLQEKKVGMAEISNGVMAGERFFKSYQSFK